MSIADYAQRVLDYLYENGFEYADQDPRGPVFQGGILMDVGDGQKVAFLLPADDIGPALRSLHAHLEDIYPSGHTLSAAVKDGGITRVHVRLNESTLQLAG